MNLKNYFELKRFWLLLKMEITRSQKGVIMTLGIAFGFLFFLGLLLTPVFEPALNVFEHSSGYAITLLIAGFILSSMAYRDLGNPLKRQNFLTLPVSAFERFLSMWLLTSIGWIGIYTVFFTVYTWFANFVGQLVYNQLTFENFHPLNLFSVSTMKYYFVLQGIFLAGAVQFRGFAFPKTLLTLVIFGAVCGGTVYLIMKDYFQYDWEAEAEPFTGMPVDQFWKIMQWMFWWLLAPLSWVITYIGLKEQEA